jgi:hypothetical protein
MTLLLEKTAGLAAIIRQSHRGGHYLANPEAGFDATTTLRRDTTRPAIPDTRQPATRISRSYRNGANGKIFQAFSP